MPRAKQQQIIGTRLTARGPMLDVVTVGEALVMATRKAAGVVVSGPHRAFDGERHGATLATDIQRLAVFVFGNNDSVPITAQAFDGLDRN